MKKLDDDATPKEVIDAVNKIIKLMGNTNSTRRGDIQRRIERLERE